MNDKITVDLPFAVTVNETTLQPGHYTIRQLDDVANNSRILQFFDKSGMRLQTTASTLPALDTTTPSKTSVILHHYGSDYYFDKIWVQGKNYGYEFPITPAMKSREKERMEPATVAATYDIGTSEATVAAAPEAAPAPVVAQAETPVPAPAPEPVAVVAPLPAAVPVVAAAPVPAPVAVSPMAPMPETQAMPHTASSWALQSSFGLLLVGLGLALRPRTA